MINYNGSILKKEDFSVGSDNRAFRYGDGLFETMRYSNGLIYFYEDHYFRLMGSMCMMRVDIPSELNMEMLHEQILNTIVSNGLKQKSCRVRLHFFRKGTGLYTPTDLGVDYLIEVEPLEDNGYVLKETGVVSDIYFDHVKTKSVLSSIKSNNALVYVLASVFAKEHFEGDRYWFSAPYEVFGFQIHRSMVLLEGQSKRSLCIQYLDNHDTRAGEAYIYILDEKNRPLSWKMWNDRFHLDGLSSDWMDWQKSSMGFWYPSAHKSEFFGYKIRLQNMLTGKRFKDIGLSTDPFKSLRK